MTIVSRRIPALICLLACFYAGEAAYGDEPQPPQDLPVIDAYDGWQAKRERVFIIHDLFDMSVDTGTVARGFRQAGFKVDNLGYNPLSANKSSILPAMVDALYQRMRHYSEKDEEAVHFVCYALGCALMHGLLHEHRPQKLGHVLMLAAPAHAQWLVEGRDVTGWALNHPRLEGANKVMLQRYLDRPIAYDAAALTATTMTYARRTDTVFALHGQAYIEKTLKLPGLTTPVPLRIVPGNQDALRTGPDIIAEAVHYIEHGRFRP